MTQKPEYTCKECGSPISVSSYRRRRLCRSCSIKKWSKRVEERWEAYNKDHPNYCVICGTLIPWNSQRKSQGVSTCSRSCQSLLMQSKRKESKEHLEDRIIAVIKEIGRYTSLAEVRAKLHISDKLLYARGISMPDLNARAGFHMHYKPCNLSKEELEELLVNELNKDSHRTIRSIFKTHGISPYYAEHLLGNLRDIRNNENMLKLRKQKKEQEILAWLKTQSVYCGHRRVCDALHIDFYSTIKKLGIDIKNLNLLAGHRKPTVSWYEDITAEQLLQTFGIEDVCRQHTFPDCKSAKGWKLRFDFYIPSRNALIEVDGNQHYVRTNTWNVTGQQERDAIKNEYCERNGIPLYRIPAAPEDTFQCRLSDIIAKVKGLRLVTDEVHMSSNCGEHPQGQSAAKLVIQGELF